MSKPTYLCPFLKEENMDAPGTFYICVQTKTNKQFYGLVTAANDKTAMDLTMDFLKKNGIEMENIHAARLTADDNLTTQPKTLSISFVLQPESPIAAAADHIKYVCKRKMNNSPCSCDADDCEFCAINETLGMVEDLRGMY